MRITEYRTELDDNQHNILVKKHCCNCNVDGLNDPENIVNMLNDVFRLNRLAEEHLYMIALNTKNKPVGVFKISHGTVNTSICTPREIFIRALLSSASNIVLAHNHPSGDSIPSREDVLLTRRIRNAGQLMGIGLLDHIVVGDEYCSLNEQGKL